MFDCYRCCYRYVPNTSGWKMLDLNGIYWRYILKIYAVWSNLLQPAKRTPPNISRSKNSNTQWTEKKTTDVVIHQHSRRLLKMDILMSETCWAHNKWNKIASDIKLVFHSSTIAMMDGPINIRRQLVFIVLFRWLSIVLDGLEPNPTRTIDSRGVWLNILKINGASCSFFLYRDARSTKHKI